MPTRKTESAVKTLSIAVGHDTVSGLIESPGHPLAAFVFAHGAGAGMTHPFMAKVAHGLAERGIATLRFNFPAMEQGRRRPDTPATAHATVRAAAAAAAEWWPSLPLIAGGKSFGGRMTSQAQAAQPIPGVVGLLFLGFPLHPQKKPSTDRAAHLSDVAIPMLFLQGAADALADMALIEPVVAALGARATLKSIPAADHSFHVPARSGRTDDDVLTELHDTIHAWTIGLTRHG
jgi:predicted alpha/beta-hydrolase family hydrolase